MPPLPVIDVLGEPLPALGFDQSPLNVKQGNLGPPPAVEYRILTSDRLDVRTGGRRERRGGDEMSRVVAAIIDGGVHE